jgi:hypothetical protein
MYEVEKHDIERRKRENERKKPIHIVFSQSTGIYSKYAIDLYIKPTFTKRNVELITQTVVCT